MLDDVKIAKDIVLASIPYYSANAIPLAELSRRTGYEKRPLKEYIRLLRLDNHLIVTKPGAGAATLGRLGEIRRTGRRQKGIGE